MNYTDHYLKEKIKNVIGLMKGELGGIIMTELAPLRPKAYCYLTDHNDENKEVKSTKNCHKKKT